ncbi:MAG: phosphotransferase [Bacteroidaceae bacterium]|nr:phosphotransferase [Bacteroidaceae bacterium]
MISVLKELYKNRVGEEPCSVVKLTGDGSNRAYYRMMSPHASLIGAVGTSVEENRAFIALANEFRKCGLKAPEIVAVSEDYYCYLQEDFGDETLFIRLKEARESGSFSDNDVDMLCQVMRLLPDIQYKVAKGFDFALCYPVVEFDRRSLFWDLNYFKYCFLKGVGIDFDEVALENEFEHLATLLLDEECDTFMYRDFQSRNIMWHGNAPCFIDFQGGRKGPIYYDVASFVGQARAKYPDCVVEKMIDAYISSLERYRKVDKIEFMQKLNAFSLFRLLQNLGTYGFRGLYERKKAFIESIPAALHRLSALLSRMSNDFPLLSLLVQQIAELPRFVTAGTDGLTVDVMSFSYKRGIPEDYSGNGGGFVFDCRAIHNPGRYEPYKKLTGMDAPVIEFLETKSNITEFVENACSLVDEMVSTYIERKFNHIQVCCGCTGGQHRSVYSAEHIAQHISDKFGVKVVVTHKMLNKQYIIEAK